MRRVPAFAVLVLLTSLSASRLRAATPDSPESSAPPASATARAAAAPAAPAKKSSEGRIPIGVGVKVSMLGIGGELALAVSHRTNVRFGFNAFSDGHTFDKDGVTYKGNLNLRSAQATYDMFLLKGLHLSPGVLLYNGNQVTANASVPGGRTFTLSNELCERRCRSCEWNREAHRVQGRAAAAFGDWQFGSAQLKPLQHVS